MRKNPINNKSLEQLIENLPFDPDEVKPPKRPSVKDAIVGLRDHVGNKVFTKRQLLELVEVAFPELAPVAMSNIEASISRAKDHLECIRQGEQNIYRFRKSE